MIVHKYEIIGATFMCKKGDKDVELIKLVLDSLDVSYEVEEYTNSCIIDAKKYESKERIEY